MASSSSISSRADDVQLALQRAKKKISNLQNKLNKLHHPVSVGQPAESLVDGRWSRKTFFTKEVGQPPVEEGHQGPYTLINPEDNPRVNEELRQRLPSPATQQPSNSTQQPSNSTQQPNNSTQQLSNSTQQLSNSTQQLSNSTQQLSNSTQQLSNSTQQPNNSTQQPSNSTQQPSNPDRSGIHLGLDQTDPPRDLQEVPGPWSWTLLHEQRAEEEEHPELMVVPPQEDMWSALTGLEQWCQGYGPRAGSRPEAGSQDPGPPSDPARSNGPCET
ncbi:hypothetical protein EYF80_002523 [Liparis tanakae]|uniref:Uncharacterized protein n=1 Tax=Liparis tanakae TaxID=230148 RepID=A0A4Z2JBE8_9TELE|nr:hypothetical protein EYF80_002523 [Liparis tanakae]